MGSPLEVSNIGVIFSVQGDPIWATLPPGTPSVRFEQNFVEGIMPFTFSESKIVVKSLFPILYFLKKNNKPHIFTTPLPSGRGVVKIWGLLFFGIFSNFLSESVQLQPPVSKYNFASSMIKVKNRLDRSPKTLKFFVSTISDDT